MSDKPEDPNIKGAKIIQLFRDRAAQEADEDSSSNEILEMLDNLDPDAAYELHEKAGLALHLIASDSGNAFLARRKLQELDVPSDIIDFVIYCLDEEKTATTIEEWRTLELERLGHTEESLSGMLDRIHSMARGAIAKDRREEFHVVPPHAEDDEPGPK